MTDEAPGISSRSKICHDTDLHVSWDLYFVSPCWADTKASRPGIFVVISAARDFFIPHYKFGFTRWNTEKNSDTTTMNFFIIFVFLYGFHGNLINRWYRCILDVWSKVNKAVSYYLDCLLFIIFSTPGIVIVLLLGSMSLGNKEMYDHR